MFDDIESDHGIECAEISSELFVEQLVLEVHVQDFREMRVLPELSGEQLSVRKRKITERHRLAHIQQLTGDIADAAASLEDLSFYKGPDRIKHPVIKIICGGQCIQGLESFLIDLFRHMLILKFINQWTSASPRTDQTEEETQHDTPDAPVQPGLGDHCNSKRKDNEYAKAVPALVAAGKGKDQVTQQKDA